MVILFSDKHFILSSLMVNGFYNPYRYEFERDILCVLDAVLPFDDVDTLRAIYRQLKNVQMIKVYDNVERKIILFRDPKVLEFFEAENQVLASFKAVFESSENFKLT